MSDEASLLPDGPVSGSPDVPRGAVIAGVAPGVSPRVVVEAARFARLSSAPLAVVHVDVSRFVTFEDPDGYVHSSQVELAADAARAQLEEVEGAARRALVDTDVAWSVHQLVGDPATALARLSSAGGRHPPSGPRRVDPRVLHGIGRRPAHPPAAPAGAGGPAG